MLTTLAVEGYRSLRDVVLPLGRLTAVTGPNGSGKSNLYRALRLLAEASRNGAVAALAREGGLPSTLWAGPEKLSRGMLSGEEPVQGTRRSGPVSLRLGFASDDFGYAVDLGLPVPGPSPAGRADSAFDLDPEIKRECTWSGPVARPAAVLTDRRGPAVRTRADDGGWRTSGQRLLPFDSMLSELGDPDNAPEVLALRDRLRGWRFYDHFRTDPAAPARRTSIGTRTPVLGHDGGDLAAAWQTIAEIGDAETLHAVLPRPPATATASPPSPSGRCSARPRSRVRSGSTGPRGPGRPADHRPATLSPRTPGAATLTGTDQGCRHV